MTRCRCPATAKSQAAPLYWELRGAQGGGRRGKEGGEPNPESRKPGPESPVAPILPSSPPPTSAGSSTRAAACVRPCRPAVRPSWPATATPGRPSCTAAASPPATGSASRLSPTAPAWAAHVSPRTAPRPGPPAAPHPTKPLPAGPGTRVSLVGETRERPQQRVSERVKNRGPAGGPPSPALAAPPLLAPGGASLGPSPPVPQASCRDCELQDARSSNEVLDALCASDFGEPLASSTPYTHLTSASIPAPSSV